MKLPSRVTIVEVGPRDGFQAERQWIPTEQKIEIVNALSRTGIKDIQATSFVHPKAVPQLADAEEVMSKIDRPAGVEFRVLVPNMKGLERAIAYKPKRMNFMMSVSESHNRSNANCSIEESLTKFEPMAAMALEAGIEPVGGMACTFGCPFEGEVPVAQLERVTRRYISMGIKEVGLSDTVGVANPMQVYNVAAHMLDKFPDVQWNLHLHNTRDMALANVVAAMQAGMTSFESSIGGLGGCPYAPAATGNVATEDLVNMLTEMGIETGVDLDALIAIAKRAQEIIPHRLDSCMVRAGKRTDLKPAPKEQQKLG
ncbi:MAG TPA: hydroxymethylglutaryl-CoA lyase [Chloroflexota bacterium]|nr:hydroxymethylglutaryl-CoA lyase [Chloroflexota bacterium]